MPLVYTKWGCATW